MAPKNKMDEILELLDNFSQSWLRIMSTLYKCLIYPSLASKNSPKGKEQILS
jgi:hypothetical protein